MEKREIEQIIKSLIKHYKFYRIELSAQQPSLFRMLVSTIISQRNTDTSTFRVSKALFKKYNSFKKIAEADLSDLMKILRPSGFYRTKSRRIQEISRMIISEYKGRVPKDYAALTSLPGVGRKTAGIIMTYGYGKSEGIPVDTHVFRISNRLGIVHAKTPEKTEIQLLERVPKKYWLKINSLFITHGRTICKALNPKCSICPVKKMCQYYEEVYSI